MSVFDIQNPPGVIMRLRILQEGEVFEKIVARIQKELDEKFFGTYHVVDISDMDSKHIQMILWLYRQDHFWSVDYYEQTRAADVITRGLVFRDPKSISTIPS